MPALCIVDECGNWPSDDILGKHTADRITKHPTCEANGWTGTDYTVRAIDGSTVSLWYHELDCPE